MRSSVPGPASISSSLLPVPSPIITIRWPVLYRVPSRSTLNPACFNARIRASRSATSRAVWSIIMAAVSSP